MSEEFSVFSGYFHVITKNAAECAKCKDVIVSKHRHDMVHCSCGEIFIDGGNDYQRVGFKDQSSFISRSESRRMTKAELHSALIEAIRMKNNHCYSDSYYSTKVKAIRHYLELWYGSPTKNVQENIDSIEWN
jgi:hypothetical protein